MRRAIRWANQVGMGYILLWSGPLVMFLAGVWRRLMVRATVVGVTGSVGKTPAQE